MSVTLETGMVLIGRRTDEWAINYPPAGNYWRCWQCYNGTHVNDFILIYNGWPIIGNNWYYAGPFYTVEEADVYNFDEGNPCGNFNDYGTGDSNIGGGSGWSGTGVEGGGLRFVFINPPQGVIPEVSDVTYNGVPFEGATITYKDTTLPITLGG